MADPSPPRRSLGEREFIAFVAVLSASGAIAISTLLPSFGAMRDAFDLDPTSTRISLTVTLFFLGSGVGLFIAGPLADAIGRRRVLLITLSMYGLAALASAVAPSLEVLLVSRFVWGLAAAGPRILSQAMLRDRFSGQELARSMTLVQTFFYIAPIVGPVGGKAILELAGWRWVFGSTALLAVLLLLWSTRLPETLDPANRRPFSVRTTIDGLRIAATHPVTRSYGIAIMVGYGAYYAFIGSLELVVSEIYGRPSAFVWIFASFSASMGVLAFIANQTLKRMAAHDWTYRAGLVFLIASAALLMTSLVQDGRPPFGVFIVLFAAATFGFAAVFPTGNSIALQPMGRLAGTAAAGLGGAVAIVGALLAAVVDNALSGSVTPLALGYTVYAAISLAAQITGRRAISQAVLSDR